MKKRILLIVLFICSFLFVNCVCFSKEEVIPVNYYIIDDDSKENPPEDKTELIDIDIDTLILGCTHYPLIRKTIGKVMGEGVTLVNPAYETAKELERVLKTNNLGRIEILHHIVICFL